MTSQKAAVSYSLVCSQLQGWNRYPSEVPRALGVCLFPSPDVTLGIGGFLDISSLKAICQRSPSSYWAGAVVNSSREGLTD